MLKLDKTKIGTKETIVEISDRDVAIIGLSVQMPMADDIDSFWNNIPVCKFTIWGYCG